MAPRENFGSRFAVIMAMAGSAVGLGNIWRFPYMVGEHGGAAFVILYMLSSFILVLPIFFAETIIGRRSRQGTSRNPLEVAGTLYGRFAHHHPELLQRRGRLVGGIPLQGGLPGLYECGTL